MNRSRLRSVASGHCVREWAKENDEGLDVFVVHLNGDHSSIKHRVASDGTHRSVGALKARFHEWAAACRVVDFQAQRRSCVTEQGTESALRQSRQFTAIAHHAHVACTQLERSASRFRQRGRSKVLRCVCPEPRKKCVTELQRRDTANAGVMLGSLTRG